MYWFKRSSEKGVVAVELAIFAPVLILFLATIVDFGLMVHRHQIVQNAAREGARFSSLPKHQVGTLRPTATYDQIRQKVMDYLQHYNLSVPAGDIEVVQDVLVATATNNFRATRVRVNSQYTFFTPILATTLGSNMPLEGESVFRNLY